MTIKEVKELYKGEYEDIEVYRPNSSGKHYPCCFHTDNCTWADDYNDNSEVGLWELMDENDYTSTLYANTIETADFDEYYGDKEAKVLCIMLADGRNQ